MRQHSSTDASPNDLMAALSEFKSALGPTAAQKSSQSYQLRKRNNMYSAPLSRPVLSSAMMEDCAHKSAFDAYLRDGSDDGLRALPLEGKGMSTAVAADGGYLVDPQTSETVKSTLKGAASLRQVASVVNVDATSYDVLVDRGDMGSVWNAETTAMSETGSGKVDRISIALHELSALPKVSQRLLDDSAFDLETWMAGRIAETFARAEADAFINGDGNNKPKGILKHATVDNASWAWGKLGFVKSGVSGALNSPDPIVDMVYALGSQYRANASFVMNSRTAAVLRRIKDADGRFLWGDSLSAAEPARLMGYPVIIIEEMPDIAAGSLSIAFGDFGAGYTIAERPDLRILRDPFSAKPHVMFYATKRMGADVTDFAAIKLMKFSA